MDRLVTPEAVALDLPLATVATRSLGRLLDLCLQALVVVLVLTGAGAVGSDDVVTAVAALVAVFLVRLAYPVVLETRYGATLGQRAVGLRIVTDDGGPIRARQAVVRATIGLFEIELTGGLLAFTVAASRADGKRLGDVAAGTVAVSVRTGSDRARVLEVACPPQLRGWASTLDLTGLTAAHRTALRRFHERARTLGAARRDELAAPLAARLLDALAATPPTRAGPVDVLAAIQWALASGEAVDRRGGGVGDTGGSGRGAPAPRPATPPPPAPPGTGVPTEDDGFAPPA